MSIQIFIGRSYDSSTDRWDIAEDGIFLKEEDARAWVQTNQDKYVQELVDKRNEEERARFKRQHRAHIEDKALRDAGIRSKATPIVYPRPLEVYTQPHWRTPVRFVYEEYEAR